MTAGEMINKLGEVPAETPVECPTRIGIELVKSGDRTVYRFVDIVAVSSADYDEERGIVVLS